MSQYFNLKVKQIIRETEDAVTIAFHPTESIVKYKSGQFLTFILPLEGEKIRRSYSLCSVPYIDKELAVTVKKVVHGKASTYLVDYLKEGVEIEVMQPLGTFHLEANQTAQRDIVLIGAGSGITPLYSMARTVLSCEPLSNVYLLYGNRNEDSIIFKEKLNDLKKEHGDRLNIVHILSQPYSKLTLPSGRMNQSLIIKLLESFSKLNMDKALYYICGPEGMMAEAKKALEILKVKKENIHQESFIASSSPEPVGEVVESGDVKDQEVTIIYQGSEYKVRVPISKTILQAALDSDIDLPYSCQSGMCTACMGKCTSGKVQLDDADGLSDKEIKMGYVLTCVGHPVTSDVVIEID
ncbi:MAG TPA: ferredoxin--NADP reductase [Cytophagaceae bacterium]|jgi:ring-1,2-phenylacetyl-CoA epoxidase subunit PaaE